MPATRTHQDATGINPRLLSSPSSATSPPPPRSTHARARNSSSTSKQGHIPRPPNSFFIFRSEMISKHKLKEIEPDQRNISRIVSHLWNDLPEDEKEKYRQAAELRKMQHALENPGYKYQPNTTLASQKERRRRVGVEDEAVRARKIADNLMLGSEPQVSPSSTSSDHNVGGYPVMSAPPMESQLHYSAAPYYPSTAFPSASYYPPSSTSSTSHHAYPSIQPYYSSSPAYPEQQNQPINGNEALTDEQLQYLMEQFNY